LPRNKCIASFSHASYKLKAKKHLEHDNTILKTQNEGYAARIKALEKQVEELMGFVLSNGGNSVKRMRAGERPISLIEDPSTLPPRASVNE
jgi:hypothetical protein